MVKVEVDKIPGAIIMPAGIGRQADLTVELDEVTFSHWGIQGHIQDHWVECCKVSVRGVKCLWLVIEELKLVLVEV